MSYDAVPCVNYATTSDGESTFSAAPELSTEPHKDVTQLLSEVLESQDKLRLRDSVDNIGTFHYTNSSDYVDGKSSNQSKLEPTSPPMFPYLNNDRSDISQSDKKDSDNVEFLAEPLQYFIFSAAGKVIYSMNGTDKQVIPYTGILQTILETFAENQTPSNLKSFRAGQTLFVFQVEGPVVLVAIDRHGRHNESHLQTHLSVLYAQILSVLTKTEIAKAFENRPGFDLRRLLGDFDVQLSVMAQNLAKGAPPVFLGAVECLKLKKSVREELNNILAAARSPNLLYGMIVSDARLAAVIRPKRHSLHPSDLYLIFSMLFNASSYRESGNEHWTPICLPKFNSNGFLHAYFHFFSRDSALVLISPDRNAFYEMRAVKSEILDKLKARSLEAALSLAVSKERFKPMDIPAPLIRHFLYKAKEYVQFVMPSIDLHFYEPKQRQQLMNLYHELHAAVHHSSQQAGSKVNIIYLVRHNITALAWITPRFEMYCIAGPTTKNALFQSVRAAVAWIKHQEERLFILRGAVF